MSTHVLVADDSPTIRRRAQATLGEAGFDVTCVEDGEAAWGAIQSGRRPDVLLCDILMPMLDGYELCSRVKGDPRFASVPVLLLRGTFEPWDEAKAHDAGADGFITKPFEPENLVGTVRDVLEGLAEDEGSGSPVEEEAGSPVEEPASLPPEDETRLSVLQPELPPPEPQGLPPEDETMLSPLREEEPVASAPEQEAPPDRGTEPDPFASSDDDPFALGSDEPAAPAPAPAQAQTAPLASAGTIDEAALEALANRVATKLAGDVLEKLAWEIVPEVAEALVRKRMLEIESKLQGG